ncbi:SGNH/GDSL hydrolase family protein [Arthrobacter sedimenti]|uniref:SGNH/GDSL hydrolase family protein n=1 Tax=Arthrobacter sedimenti TaxID=2694931 RepID=UPI000B363F97|nr:SGNH/GDSL hydrolase family protein [Arthrobacter sedimenti]OUM40861.1 hypothetical protein B8W73_10755 [Arthrobacter agilis]
MEEALPYIRKKKRRPSISRRASIVAVVCAVLAVVLCFTGLFVTQREVVQANAEAASEFTSAPVAPPSRPTMPPLPPGSKVLFIGDSWAQGVGAIDQVNGNWAALTADHFGWDRTIDGIGGTGFTRGGGAGGGAIGTDNKQYVNRLDRWIAEGMNPDLVVLEGGLNDDKADPAVLRAAVRQAVEKAKTAWPGAAVLVIGPAAPQPLASMIKRMAEPIRIGALDAGAFSIQPVLENWFTSGNSPQFLLPGDGAHVNDIGHQYTSERVVQAIKDRQDLDASP